MTELTAAEQETIATYDRQAENWATDHLTRGFWAEELAAFHRLLPAGRILEIGSGGGRDARELIEYGYDYVGTDIASGLIAQAQKHNPDATFVQRSVYDLGFEDEFDGFWCSAVLLHIPRDRISEALGQIRHACRAGALGFISVKEGIGEKLETDSFGSRFFTYWQNEDFQKTLSKLSFAIEYNGYRPMSERTRWLTYIVRVDR